MKTYKRLYENNKFIFEYNEKINKTKVIYKSTNITSYGTAGAFRNKEEALEWFINCYVKEVRIITARLEEVLPTITINR